MMRQAIFCRKVRLVDQELVLVSLVLILNRHQLRRSQGAFYSHDVGVAKGYASSDPPTSSGQVYRGRKRSTDLQRVDLGPAFGVVKSVAV